MEVGYPLLPDGNSTVGTPESGNYPIGYPYGAVTLCGPGIPPGSGSLLGKAPDPQPHISLGLLPGIRFGLFPFRSPLLRESLLLSFPAGTEMFHFPAFPLRVKPGVLGFYPSGSSHSGIRGSTVACTSPRHLAACRPLLRLPSPGIHRAGSWGYMWFPSSPSYLTIRVHLPTLVGRITMMIRYMLRFKK